MSATWASGWVAGDIVTAAEFKKGAGLIADSTLGGSAVSIDLTSLPTSYAHLLLLAYVRTDRAATSDSLLLRFNNDSTAIYDYSNATASGTANPTTGNAVAATSIAIATSIPGATASANRFGVVAAWIPHYAGVTNHKAVTASYWSVIGTTTADTQNGFGGGMWRSAAAISRITILPLTGTNLVAGSRFSIYAFGA